MVKIKNASVLHDQKKQLYYVFHKYQKAKGEKQSAFHKEVSQLFRSLQQSRNPYLLKPFQLVAKKSKTVLFL